MSVAVENEITNNVLHILNQHNYEDVLESFGFTEAPVPVKYMKTDLKYWKRGSVTIGTSKKDDMWYVHHGSRHFTDGILGENGLSRLWYYLLRNEAAE
jgi:hypothetical protein